MPVQIGAQPDAGFDRPLALMSDCHRRIERFLALLLQLARTRNGAALDEEARVALGTALRYFREAAPKHAADEEQSLFPRMRSRPDRMEPALAAMVAGLEADHQTVRVAHDAVDRLGNLWLHDDRLAPADLDELVGHLEALERAYAEHIHIEDAQVFPAAGRMLSPEELAEIGREMAQRRGVSR